MNNFNNDFEQLKLWEIAKLTWFKSKNSAISSTTKAAVAAVLLNSASPNVMAVSPEARFDPFYDTKMQTQIQSNAIMSWVVSPKFDIKEEQDKYKTISSKSSWNTINDFQINPSWNNSLDSRYSVWKKWSYQFDIAWRYENISSSLLWKHYSSQDDFILGLSYRFLFSWSKMWTYIGIEKWSNFEKFVLSQWFSLDWWRLKLSASILERLTPFFYPEYQKSFKEKISQKSIWLEYSKLFDKESVLNELKTKVVYYDVWDKYLGKLEDIIIDNPTTYDWTRVEAAAVWWSKLLADVTAVWKVSENLRVDTTIWFDSLSRNSSYQNKWETTDRLVTWVEATYKIDDTKKISIWQYNSQTFERKHIRYTQAVSSWEFFVWVENISNPYNEQNVINAWYRVQLWWDSKAKLSDLFYDRSSNNWLSLNDLSPISSVNSNYLQVYPKQVVFKTHLLNVDKSKLPTGSYIDKNIDNTPKSLNIALWVNNLVAVDSVSPSYHANYFSIVWWSYLSITNLEKLDAPSVYNIVLLDSNGSYSLLTFETTKWSVEFNIAMQKINWVSREVANAYKNKTIDTQILSELFSWTLSPQIVNKIVTWTITREQVEAYKRWELTVWDLNNIESWVNKTTLITKISQAQWYNSSLYTSDSYQILTTAINNAINIRDNFSSTQQQVDSAILSIEQAILWLVRQSAPIMWDVPDQTYTSGTAITNLNISDYVTLTNWDAITSYTLTWTLPTWLSFNSTTWVISGTPTQTWTFNLSVISTDNDGNSNSDSFTITVNEAADTTAPTAEVWYSNTNPTNQGVVVTVTLNEDGWRAPSWWTKTWNTTYTKTYSSNINENVVFTDVAWNQVQKNIVITNIDKIMPYHDWDSINVWNNTTWTWIIYFSEDVTLTGLSLANYSDDSAVWWSVTLVSWTWTRTQVLNITTPDLPGEYLKVIWTVTDTAWNQRSFESSPWELE